METEVVYLLMCTFSLLIGPSECYLEGPSQSKGKNISQVVFLILCSYECVNFQNLKILNRQIVMLTMISMKILKC